MEKDHWSASDESMHEFKVCIKCEDLARIMEHSKANKEVSKIFSQFVAYIFFIRDFGFIQFLKKRVVFFIVFSHCFLIIENIFIWLVNITMMGTMVTLNSGYETLNLKKEVNNKFWLCACYFISILFFKKALSLLDCVILFWPLFSRYINFLFKLTMVLHAQKSTFMSIFARIDHVATFGLFPSSLHTAP